MSAEGEERNTHVQFIEQHSIRGAVGSWLCCLPELLLRRVAVHGTQLEQAIWKKNMEQTQGWLQPLIIIWILAANALQIFQRQGKLYKQIPKKSLDQTNAFLSNRNVAPLMIKTNCCCQHLMQDQKIYNLSQSKTVPD